MSKHFHLRCGSPPGRRPAHQSGCCTRNLCSFCGRRGCFGGDKCLARKRICHFCKCMGHYEVVCAQKLAILQKAWSTGIFSSIPLTVSAVNHKSGESVPDSKSLIQKLLNNFLVNLNTFGKLLTSSSSTWTDSVNRWQVVRSQTSDVLWTDSRCFLTECVNRWDVVMYSYSRVRSLLNHCLLFVFGKAWINRETVVTFRFPGPDQCLALGVRNLLGRLSPHLGNAKKSRSAGARLKLRSPDVAKRSWKKL